MIRFIKNNTIIFAIASLTLGLAPFTPEPHLISKLKWVWGGAVDMGALDWFDLLLHGSPFLFLIASLVLKMKKED